MVLWLDLEMGNVVARLKLLTGEWSHQKRKGYHQVSIVRVSRHGYQLRSMVVDYDPSVTIQGKALVTSVLYLKRTSHN